MTTRQELYDRIRSSSKDEVILDEMVRLGFWPGSGATADGPAEEVRRIGELERQLRALTTENRRLGDVEGLKQAAHKRRLEESKRRRQEAKQRKLEEREARAAQWRIQKERDILYLGYDVSGGLQDGASDEQKLRAAGLPVLGSASELAAAMGITIGAVRFLSYHRRAATTSHYRRFAVAKKSGGERVISAPMPRLKRAQQWILEHILEHVPLHRAAHGFRKGRSIVTNASPHVNAAVVVNLDLEDFFPTVTFARIRGVFRKFGYNEKLATILALICSEPDAERVELDGRRYDVSKGPRRLPQGAPTSPAITNIICRGLDARLTHLAETHAFRYTRYADDITFSGDSEAAQHVGRVLRRTRFVIHREGFRVHPQKTRVLRRSRRQEVTGLTVNERVNISRRELRRFRALLFQIERDGPAGKRWGNTPNVMEAIEGFANYVHMVDPDKGAALRRKVEELIQRHGRGTGRRIQRQRWQPRPEAPPVVQQGVEVAQPENSAGKPAAQKPDPQPPRKPWWKFW